MESTLDKTRCYTLHVKNIPIDLEKDGIKSIFLEYGCVTGVMIIKGTNNTNQAYISYSNYNEAERAINELNEKLPLLLLIQFKDKNLNKNKININVDLSNPINDFRYKDNTIDNVQNVRQIIDIGRVDCSPILKSKIYTSDDELLYSVPNDSVTYNPYEPIGQFYDTNLMYTRGILQVSRNGHRRISYGRGCMQYNLPKPHHNIATYIQSICEKREKGLYEYFTSDIENDTGKCHICLIPTAYKCQRCNITFYCSKSCQIDDWPKHKLKCQPMPLLAEVHTNTSAPNISEIIVSEEPKVLKQKTLRCPKPQNTLPEIFKEISTNRVSLDKNIYQLSNEDVQENLKSNTSSEQLEHEKFKNSFSITLCNNDDKTEFIPKDTFITVIITTLLKNNECLVQKIDAKAEIVKLFVTLQDYVESQVLVEPEEYVLCILKNENLWYRATIISYKKNSNSYVYYHDFGTYGEIMVHKVCPITSFENIPYYARQIRFIEESNICKNLQEGDTIFVKAINNTKDGIIIVEARTSSIKNNNNNDITDEISKCNINDNSSVENNTSEPITNDDIAITNILKLPSVLETLEVGENGFILIHAKLSQHEYNVTLVPNKLINKFTSLLDEMKAHCLEELTKNSMFRPKIGDFICGQSMEAKEWFRGIVISTIPIIKLAVIDESRIFVPIECTPISSNYSSICSLGLICQFPANAKMPDTKLETGYFKVIKIAENTKDTVLIEIIIDDSICIKNIVLKKWIPKIEQKGVEYAPLKSGDKVSISHFSSQNLMYVLNQEPEMKELTHRLEQNIAKYALNKQSLTEIPVIGQIVMAHYKTDSNYYRAIVIKEKDQKYLIKYIDYGNEEITTLDNLFVLPDSLKKHPSCAAKIRLKDVNRDVPLNLSATRYFQELMAESELICTFDGHPFEDGVLLKTLQNENVNYKMNVYITPTWEKENNEEDTKIFYMNDLPMLKLGDVGEEVEAIVLLYSCKTNILILGLNDEVAATAIQVELPERISKYVESTTDHYIPRDEELCIAKYKDVFYRAVCIDSSASPTMSHVFFLDYGNSACVDHTDIRVFTQDFATLGAYGILCDITPMVPKDKMNVNISKRINELILVFNILKIKIISMDIDGTPNIDIPAIREQLIKEKLI